MIVLDLDFPVFVVFEGAFVCVFTNCSALDHAPRVQQVAGGIWLPT